MKTQRLGQIITFIKRPVINDIEFPNMRIRKNFHQSKSKKKMKNQDEKLPIQTCSDFNKLKRTYSVNVLTHRRDIKLMFTSPKKKQHDSQAQFVTSHKDRYGKNQLLLLGHSPKQKVNFQSKVHKHNRRFTLLDPGHNINKDSQENRSSLNQKVFLETIFPGIKLSNNESNQKESNFLRNSSPGMLERQNFNQQGYSLRQSKKKPLFNGKLLSIRRRKQGYPQELILRKLVWEGKESKKVDHHNIYKEMVQKIRPQKYQQISFIQFKQEVKKGDEMLLTAWEDIDQHGSKRQTIQTRER